MSAAAVAGLDDVDEILGHLLASLLTFPESAALQSRQPPGHRRATHPRQTAQSVKKQISHVTSPGNQQGHEAQACRDKMWFPSAHPLNTTHCVRHT
jgi:hypothetical protein